MLHAEGVSGKPSPNGKADDHLTSEPSASTNGKAHATGKPAANGKPTTREWTILISLRFLREQTTMTDRAFRVLVALEAYTRENRGCYPSNGTIARLTGKSKSAVTRILTELESEGFIRRVPRPGGGDDRIGITLLKRTDARLPLGENADTPSAKTPRPTLGENADHKNGSTLPPQRKRRPKEGRKGPSKDPIRPSRPDVRPGTAPSGPAKSGGKGPSPLSPSTSTHGQPKAVGDQIDELELALPALEADVAGASQPTAMRIAELALDRARADLAALKRAAP